MKKRTKHLLQRVRHRLIKRSPNQIISEILFRAIFTLDGKIISTESLLEESSNALNNILSYNKQVSDSFADKTSSLESRLNSITRWFLLSGSIKCCWVSSAAGQPLLTPRRVYPTVGSDTTRNCKWQQQYCIRSIETIHWCS